MLDVHVDQMGAPHIVHGLGGPTAELLPGYGVLDEVRIRGCGCLMDRCNFVAAGMLLCWMKRAGEERSAPAGAGG
jgi:uncharacterized protein YodC (DUF2158 family)